MSGERKHAFEVKWRIENLKSWFETRDDTLYSPQFLAETLMNTRWKLSLSTNWQLAEKYLTLTLQRDVEDNGPEFIVLNYELMFLASDESHIISKSCKSKFSSKTAGHELNVKQVEILKEKMEAYLPEGVLTVYCKFWYAWSTVSKGGQCSIWSVIGKNCITLDGAIDHFNRQDKSKFTVNFMSPSSDISFISFCAHSLDGFMNFNRKKVECKCFSWYSCQLFRLDARGIQIEFCNRPLLETLLSLNNPCSFKCNGFWNQLKHNEYLQNGTLKFQLKIAYYPGVESERVEYDVHHYKKVADESADLENVNTSNAENSDEFSQLQYIKELKKLYSIEETESSEENERFGTVGNRHLAPTSLGEDLISLYNERLFCDTKLRTGTETFPAHRFVLSARSPVFKKMFTTDMKEAGGECINVPDISSDTVRRLLQFLYTDCTGDLEMQNAKDLYIASDKYDIATLKQRCSSFIKENLCPSNVCEVLVLADMHQDKDLESVANEYVLNYDEEVFGSDEWKLFMQNYSGLAARIMYLKLRKNK